VPALQRGQKGNQQKTLLTTGKASLQLPKEGKEGKLRYWQGKEKGKALKQKSTFKNTSKQKRKKERSDVFLTGQGGGKGESSPNGGKKRKMSVASDVSGKGPVSCNLSNGRRDTPAMRTNWSFGSGCKDEGQQEWERE